MMKVKMRAKVVRLSEVANLQEHNNGHKEYGEPQESSRYDQVKLQSGPSLSLRGGGCAPQ